MKVSAAALPFLILAAMLGRLALGLPTHGDQGGGSLSLNHEQTVAEDGPRVKFARHGAGIHIPENCCSSYIEQTIQCVNMKRYYKTSSACSKPAVIFITKGGQELCADPYNVRVQNCVMELASD